MPEDLPDLYQLAVKLIEDWEGDRDSLALALKIIGLKDRPISPGMWVDKDCLAVLWWQHPADYWCVAGETLHFMRRRVPSSFRDSNRRFKPNFMQEENGAWGFVARRFP